MPKMSGLEATAAILVALAGLSMYPTREFSDDMHSSILAPMMLRGASTALPVEAKTRARWMLDEAQRRLEPLYADFPAHRCPAGASAEANARGASVASP